MFYLVFNFLPDSSIFKAFVDDNVNGAKMSQFVFDTVENIVRRGGNAGYHHFLLFPQQVFSPFPTMFSKDFKRVVKVRIVWLKVK